MPTVQIKHRFTNAVLYEHQTTDERLASGLTMRDAVEAVCKTVAYLTGANLTNANLAGANLTGAYLAGDVKLVGYRPVFQIGPIGSRSATLTLYLTNEGPIVRTGCFFGDLEKFESAVVKTHANAPEHRLLYLAAIALMRAHSAQWTPATVAA